MINEQTSIRDLAEKIARLNLSLNINYSGGGYYISLTNLQYNVNIVSVSGNIIDALNDCFEKIENLNIEIRHADTLPVTKKMFDV